MKTFALSPAKKLDNMSSEQRKELQNRLNGIGANEFGIDFEILFHADENKLEELKNIAMDFDFNLIQY